MAKNLYLTTNEARSGKSMIALGLMELLRGAIGKVAFFRPIILTAGEGERDRDIQLLLSHFELSQDYSDAFALTFAEAGELLAKDREDYLIEIILSKYQKLEEQYDFVLIEGTDFAQVTSAIELDINARIARNLAAPVLLVSSGKFKSVTEAVNGCVLAAESWEDHGHRLLGCVLNRLPAGELDRAERLLRESLGNELLCAALPEVDILGSLTMREVVLALNAKIIYGEEYQDRHAKHHLIAAMQPGHFLERLTEGSLVITPGDRTDIILACLSALCSARAAHIMGLVLTGGFGMESVVENILRDLSPALTVATVPLDTLRTAAAIHEIECKIYPADERKITSALATFEKYINTQNLRERIITARSDVITPKMFEYRLIQQARQRHKHIVLPEGAEERILRAAEILRERDVVSLTLLGNEEEIRMRAAQLGLQLRGVQIVDPSQSPWLAKYAERYFELRSHKGVTMDQARELMLDGSYFGTMMVYQGDADGMVSGSINTTQHTIRPALEFIKTEPGFSLVSSVFFMCLTEKVLVYGDCAVIPDPDASQLAQIAVASARTAAAFGIEPRVALLSYSTGDSGKGQEVEKVREATRLARQLAPDLAMEGPMQYDAAVDAEVARSKMPDSKVAGRATVFIFPDLNTGNNTYKAVQRSAGAVAVGPVLQGLNKPVNDLSRGCTIADIVNTVAITAIQAAS
ncbi:MAG: phosphate acetyltransferase [Spirochaetales bacterium]|nr:phosphate acetyltransferase [Spirochaetales bacterium]